MLPIILPIRTKYEIIKKITFPLNEKVAFTKRQKDKFKLFENVISKSCQKYFNKIIITRITWYSSQNFWHSFRWAKIISAVFNPKFEQEFLS